MDAWAGVGGDQAQEDLIQGVRCEAVRPGLVVCLIVVDVGLLKLSCAISFFISRMPCVLMQLRIDAASPVVRPLLLKARSTLRWCGDDEEPIVVWIIRRG